MRDLTAYMRKMTSCSPQRVLIMSSNTERERTFSESRTPEPKDELKREADLHSLLEHVLQSEAEIPQALPKLPEHIKKLLMEISYLEETILNLEEQVAFLNWQLGYEQRERQRTESTLLKLPMKMYSQELESKQANCFLSPEMSSGNHSSCLSLSPRWFSPASTLSDVKVKIPGTEYSGPIKYGSYQNTYSKDSDCNLRIESVENVKLGCSDIHRYSSPDKFGPLRTLYGELASKAQIKALENCWHKPNKLSQKMLKCMIRIYKNLAEPADDFSPSSISDHSGAESVFSSSESSFVACADVNLRSIGTQNDQPFDPYRTPMKLPWADIGSYRKAIVVSQICVGKDKLDYAANNLRTFRSLVQQLSYVDPSKMKHDEKLAFWINIYNALMMHAYLAYGVPKNDFKFFTMMQKAAYTVGGHSFNAVVIEHLLLKAKPQWYRPQMALLLERQRLKLREEVNKFAIDNDEPLVMFGLSFGAKSCPAVRMYTAENVHRELHSALQDYACASVGVSARGRLLIPKLLFEFGCHSTKEDTIMEWVCQFLPLKHATLIRNCWMHRQEKLPNTKHFAVIPFDFQFQYLFLLRHSKGIKHT